MNPAAPPTPLQRVAFLVNHLMRIIGVLYLGSPQGGRIPRPLLALANQRLAAFREQFARLAASILAGTYRPRRFTSRPGTAPGAAPGKPRTETPLRRRGWLTDYLPGAVAAPLRGGLLYLLEDPETQALISAAPAEMARLFRPLCWMLKLKPPQILARRRREAPAPQPARAAKAATTRQRQSPPAPPPPQARPTRPAPAVSPPAPTPPEA